MSIPTPTLRRFSASVQRRFRNARPGSVLILVVALLVLMALIGTAWLSTARSDRYTTKVATNSTEIDLLTEGVIRQDKGAQLSDVAPGGKARLASLTGYGSHDSAQTDSFIASRTPVVLRDVCPLWSEFDLTHSVALGFIPTGLMQDEARPRKYFEGQFVRVQLAPGEFEYYVCTHTHTVGPTNDNVPSRPGPPTPTHEYWRLIGLESEPPPATGDPTSATRQVYSNTFVWPMLSQFFNGDKFVDIQEVQAQTALRPATPYVSFTDRTFAIPTFMTFGGDPKFPALRIYSSNAYPANAVGRQGDLVTLPAADTDNDGVADALLVKLPVGTLDGLDYYAAVRVVDNNAVINLNSAFSQTADVVFVPPTGPAPYSYQGMLGTFKSGIGLYEWLNPNTEASEGNPRSLELAALNTIRFGGTTPSNTSAQAAITFQTWGEAMETDMTRRMASPVGQYRPLSVGQTAAYLYRGGLLRNPDVAISPLEKGMSDAKVWTNTGERLQSQFYDPLWDRMPNNWDRTNAAPDTQKWTSYKNAPLSAGPRLDGYGNIAHYYDADYDAQYRQWPSFIHRWFDENFNQWGYNDNPTAQIVTPPDNYAKLLAPTQVPRLLMGADHNPLTVPAPDKAVRRAIRAFLTGSNPLNNQAMLREVNAVTLPAQMQALSTIQPRASVNTAGFAELYRAYWAVMAEEWSQSGEVITPAPNLIQRIPASHTPFSQFYRYVRGYPDIVTSPGPREARLPTAPIGWHNNPFFGNRFVSDAPPPNTLLSHQADRTGFLFGQHPARMFRSPLRPTFATAATPWNSSTPRMQPDQVLLLRAALAAVNTIDLRDGDNNITFEDIDMPATQDTTINSGTFPGDATPALTIRVFGTEQQPFITEVYANTMAASRTDPDRYPAINGLDNTNGYVAIELHNPYDTPMDIRNCRIATINRQDADPAAPNGHRNTNAGPPAPPLAPINYVHDYDVSKLRMIDRTLAALPDDQKIILDPGVLLSDGEPAIVSNVKRTGAGDFHSPSVIPAHGFLVLENYDARDAASPSTDTRRAKYRPPALQVHGPNDLPGEPGPVYNADNNRNISARRNFAYVRNLDRVINQEFVLLRPYNAVEGVGVTIADAPGTARQFVAAGTGDGVITNMVPLDSYDFTGLLHPTDPGALASGRAYAWHYARACDQANGKAFHCVYPGRYDGNKSIPDAAGEQRPRTQGTDEARQLVDPTVADPVPDTVLGWDPGVVDPWEPRGPMQAAPLPGGVPPQPGFSFGDEKDPTGGTTAPDASYPVEFTIQIQNNDTPSAHSGPSSGWYPHGGFGRNGDILQVPFIGAYRIQLPAQAQTPATATSVVLEVNALTMDAAFAEDTDGTNDPPANGTAETPGVHREQIGRFVPLPATDLSIAARGTVDDPAVPPPATPAPAPSTGFNLFSIVRDLERTETADFWAGANPGTIVYDMVITGGAGQGRMRTIAAFDATPTKRELYSMVPWADAVTSGSKPALGSTYELRRGTYRWATDLFDYLTVHSPHEDAVPNIPGGTAVRNSGGAADANDPLEGLININTAPWRVLAAIPWTAADQDKLAYDETLQIQPIGTGQPNPRFAPGQLTYNATPPTNGIPDNYDIARAIVAFRDAEIAAGADPTHVFDSIYDLLRVPGIQNYIDSYYMQTQDWDDEDGDLTPYGNTDPPPPPVDGWRTDIDNVRGDFEEQFLFLTRVSNLITTHSDSFTNYVLVQGWRGIGNGVLGDEELVIQKRRSFTSDRSRVTNSVKDIPLQFFFNE